MSGKAYRFGSRSAGSNTLAGIGEAILEQYFAFVLPPKLSCPIECDAVKPRPNRGTSLETATSGERNDEDLLREILGIAAAAS